MSTLFALLCPCASDDKAGVEVGRVVLVPTPGGQLVAHRDTFAAEIPSVNLCLAADVVTGFDSWDAAGNLRCENDCKRYVTV